jgi:uncharacterized protein YqeY
MQQQIEDDINVALKRGDRTTAEALRFLKSSLINARIALGHDLTDEEVVATIRKEVKSRIEARDLYKDHGQLEQAAKEESERGIYIDYLPKDLSQEQLDALINEAASQLSDDLTFAKLMPLAMKLVAGRADGKKYIEER